MVTNLWTLKYSLKTDPHIKFWYEGLQMEFDKCFQPYGVPSVSTSWLQSWYTYLICSGCVFTCHMEQVRNVFVQVTLPLTASLALANVIKHQRGKKRIELFIWYNFAHVRADSVSLTSIHAVIAYWGPSISLSHTLSHTHTYTHSLTCVYKQM